MFKEIVCDRSVILAFAKRNYIELINALMYFVVTIRSFKSRQAELSKYLFDNVFAYCLPATWHIYKYSPQH